MTSGRQRLTNATEATPAAVEANFGAAASLAGAVGIQRMGGEDAHADQGEDSC